MATMECRCTVCNKLFSSKSYKHKPSFCSEMCADVWAHPDRCMKCGSDDMRKRDDIIHEGKPAYTCNKCGNTQPDGRK